MFATTWRRPTNFEHPRVWKTFERQTQDGHALHFTVQDATEEYKDEMFELFTTQYVFDEPWNMSTGLATDTEGLKAFKEYVVKEMLPQKMTLICLLNKNEAENQGKKAKLISFNLLSVRRKSDVVDHKKYHTTKSLKTFLDAFDFFLGNAPNVFEKYKIDVNLTSIALCVDREFRGLSISTEMLTTRKLLMKTFSVPVSTTVFTAIGSQKAAKRAGFQDDFIMSYDTLIEKTGVHFKSNVSNTKLMSLTLN